MPGLHPPLRLGSVRLVFYRPAFRLWALALSLKALFRTLDHFDGLVGWRMQQDLDTVAMSVQASDAQRRVVVVVFGGDECWTHF